MKKIVRLIAAICVLAVLAAGIYYSLNRTEAVEYSVYKETTVMRGSVIAGVTESGSISIDTNTQSYDLDFVSAQSSAGGFSINSNQGASSQETEDEYLVVDTVYVAEGSIVEVGDPVLKLTEDSIAAVRAELEDAILDAQEVLDNAQFDDEQTLMKAKHEHDTNLAAGETAQWVMENTIKKLEQNITDAEDKITELNEKIDDLNDELAEVEAWNDGNNNEDYTETKEKLEKQLKSYNTQMETLEVNLKQAKINLTTGKVSAQETYDVTMFNYENAEYIYNKAVEEVGKDTQDAKDDLEEAKQNLADFESFVGDGIIYAQYSGSVTTIGYKAGDELTTSTDIAVYTDLSKITMEVDVMQDDLTVVELGKSVRIEFVAYPDEIYTGTVKAIGDANTSSSTTSYPVTITVDSYPERILGGMTGSVTFVTKEASDVLYVSNKAITLDGTVSYVQYYDEAGNVERKEVTTGFSNGSVVEISGDIAEGDVLLIESKVSGQ